jgi:hypothetical protein
MASALKSIAIVFGHFEKHVLPQRNAHRGENRQAFPDHAFGPRCVGGWGAEVNSGEGCRRSRQGFGFPQRFHGLAPDFQPAAGASSTR